MEEQKHRLEMSQVRREMEKVMENFEKSREVSAIVDRKRKRGDELQQVSWSNGERIQTFTCFPLSCQPITRRFKQRKCVKVPQSSLPLSFSGSHPTTSSSAAGSELSDSLLKKVCVHF